MRALWEMGLCNRDSQFLLTERLCEGECAGQDVFIRFREAVRVSSVCLPTVIICVCYVLSHSPT